MTKLPCFPALIAALLLAACAAAPRPSDTYPVKITSQGPVEITGATAHVLPYGLVIKGRIHIAGNVPASTTHSVDVFITGPDGKQIRKFSSRYFPVPKPDKSKPQQAHFTMVTYDLPPVGSVVTVSLTPEPKPEEPGEPAPENP